MRVIAAAFSLVVAFVVLFIFAYFILAAAVVGWQLPWDKWPSDMSVFSTATIRDLVVANAFFIVRGSVAAAVIGAFLFAISCLGDGCNAALLGARRAISFACIFGIAFQILYALLLEVTCTLYGAYIGYQTGASLSPDQARTITPAQLKPIVTQHILDTFVQYRLEILLGPAVVSALLAWWIGNVIAYSDWLPWCNGWVARSYGNPSMKRKEFRRRF